VGWFRDWRRARILTQTAVDEKLWRLTVERYPFAASLTASELQRLRELVTLFLH
jgi:Mlc titration factor MtfA (ptsG expression regulator)